ncbi:hypothetical protein LCGC14_0245300 [marine sediment metagenome]|uniref:Uncharacterized protein n=1 Tax=marine sediment metagenome TaxID=412755 RepID=A0A0F9UAF9_9ZZZZ
MKISEQNEFRESIKKRREGGIKPPEMFLEDLVSIDLDNYMVNFRNSLKEIPLLDTSDPPKSINNNAVQYRSQIIRLIGIVSKYKDHEYIEFVYLCVRALLGRVSSHSFLEIKDGNQDKWEELVSGLVPKIFEQLAETTPEGKKEYNELP